MSVIFGYNNNNLFESGESFYLLNFSDKENYSFSYEMEAITPFPCDICGQTFSQRALLTTHFRIHTGEKLYDCDICEKTFTWKHRLTSHKRIYTGERPYVCNICEKTFTRKDKLTHHKKIHTGLYKLRII